MTFARPGGPPFADGSGRWPPGSRDDKDGEPVTLDDGTVVLVRSLGAADRHAVVAAFSRLSAESRFRRFFSAKRTLTDADLDFLDQLDGLSQAAIGAFARDDDGRRGDLVGLARYARLGSHDGCAEVGITIGDAWQRRGVGRALMARLVSVAAMGGLKRLRLYFQADNEAMRRFVIEGWPGTALRTAGGIIETEVDVVPGPGPSTPGVGQSRP